MPRLVTSLSLLLAAAPVFAAVDGEPTKDQLAFFESKVRPVLKENCYKCHSLEQGKAKGDLTLDTRDGWMKGGKDRMQYYLHSRNIYYTRGVFYNLHAFNA